MKKLSFLFVVAFLSIFAMTSIAAEVEEAATYSYCDPNEDYCCEAANGAVNACTSYYLANVVEICTYEVAAYYSDYCWQSAYAMAPDNCFGATGPCFNLIEIYYQACMSELQYSISACIYDYQNRLIPMICHSEGAAAYASCSDQ